MPSPRFESLSRFPWATLGRRETTSEFTRKIAEQKSRESLFATRPKITIVVALVDEQWTAAVQQTAESLREQSYANWEAVFVAEGEAAASLREIGDARLRIVTPSSHNPIDRRNEGAAIATGDWVGFVTAGDVLSPAALYQFVWEIQRVIDASLLYSNEIELGERGKSIGRFLAKAEFSRFNLLHFDAVGDFWIVRRDLFESLHGLNASCREHASHDFFLRLLEKDAKFHLVPYYFYYRRQPLVAGEGRRAIVEAHLRRLGSQDQVREVGALRWVKVVPAPSEGHLISAVICFRDRADWTLKAASALAKQVGKIPMELILVDNESTPAERAKIDAFLPTFPFPTRVVNHEGPFNFGLMHNRAVREHCRGDLLLVLNNDVFLQGEQMLDEWAAWALGEKAGTVGILLRFPHGGVQHSGIRALFGGEARLVRVGHTPDEDRLTFENREVFANTFAACLMKRSVYDAVGGLRELDLANGFGDVAFNFDCLRRGWKNLFLGHLEGVHLESASRGDEYEYWEECGLEREYAPELQKMLRYDFGYNRVPSADYSLPTALREAVRIGLRKNAPWLIEPLKPAVKKLLRGLKPREDNPIG